MSVGVCAEGQRAPHMLALADERICGPVQVDSEQHSSGDLGSAPDSSKSCQSPSATKAAVTSVNPWLSVATTRAAPPCVLIRDSGRGQRQGAERRFL